MDREIIYGGWGRDRGGPLRVLKVQMNREHKARGVFLEVWFTAEAVLLKSRELEHHLPPQR